MFRGTAGGKKPLGLHVNTSGGGGRSPGSQGTAGSRRHSFVSSPAARKNRRALAQMHRDNSVELSMEAASPATRKSLTRLQNAVPSLFEFLIDKASLGDREMINHGIQMLNLNLDLTNRGLGPEVVALLASSLTNNVCVRSLDLTRNDCRDAGVVALARQIGGNKKNNTLSNLVLDKNTISTLGCKALSLALQRTEVLTRLTLNSNMVDNQGMKYLAVALELNRSLRVLNLRSNCITDEGALSLLTILQNNHMLAFCDLSLNDISPEIVRDIEVLLWRNRNRNEECFIC